MKEFIVDKIWVFGVPIELTHIDVLYQLENRSINVKSTLWKKFEDMDFLEVELWEKTT